MKKLLYILAFSSYLCAHPDASEIGKKIWYNECKGSILGLTSWNEREEFASLGIGHFIWCPKGKACPFSETFPSLVAYLKQRGAKVPSWITVGSACPWKNREQFLKDINSPRMKELRTFLSQTVDLQTEFIMQRLEDTLPTLIKTTTSKKHYHIRQQFARLKATKKGMFALVDYVNFKGTGASVKEQYKGQGWGLLQVLERMKGKETHSAVNEFVLHAKELLTKRVEHAPKQRHEERWLLGWKNRLDMYLV